MSIEYRVAPPLENAALNELFASAWPGHTNTDFGPTLEHCLTHIAAFSGLKLVGFVKLAWDGGAHVFLLDTTVHRDWQHRGIGTELVRIALSQARARGCQWLHVDFEPQFEGFYRACGFVPSLAGLMRVS